MKGQVHMDYFVFERELEDKLASVLAEKSLLHTLDKYAYPITLTVLQNQAEDAQMSLYASADGSISSHDSVLRFVFKLDGLEVQTDSRFVIGDAFLSKVKGLAKKIHYAYLQAYFAATVSCRGPMKDHTEELDDDDPDDGSFDGFYSVPYEDGTEDAGDD